MKSVNLSGSIALALLLFAPLAQAGESTVLFKQLAGPAGEIAQMRAPDPAAAAIQSKAALLPVEFDAADEALWQGTLAVEKGSLRFLVFSGAASSWQLEMVSPSGQKHAASSLASDVRRSQFGMEKSLLPTDMYSFEGIESGTWRLKVRGAQGVADRGFVLVEGDADTELASYQTHKRQLVGERLGIAAMLSVTGAAGEVVLGTDAGRIERAKLRVNLPSGRVSEFPMFDDGRHDDGAAGDGVYGGFVPAKAAGDYLVQTVVEGFNRDGAPFVRTAEHSIPVIERDLDIAATKSALKAVRSDEARLAVAIPVTAEKKGGHYRAIAEVWGRDGEGNEIAVAWIGGMTAVKGGRIELGLDEHWIALAGAQAPFELRNLRIEDPNHFIPLAAAKRIAIDLPALSVKKAPGEIVVDERMLMGPRPAQLAEMDKGVGSRLLLVHGYCSGDVWPASHFSNASKFLDLNKNRSHDQFARLIQSFGSTWNSFGVVAHSQGGAASLHLYTYYWSGLDNASGSRLIQSVGTPYQGTNLAGILAALGNWFGVGCGTNDNLTYSGASSWLSGIPSWARSKVNYYTTSFTDVWYRYDYCNMATDVVLSDPEDGTTERAYGQLSGAYNRGHTTGQCHTAGMRDPAQYSNYSRNSTMNSNAAR